MSRQSEKKSSHLQGLESAFEKRTRRFSAFDVLGLDKDGNTSKASEPGVVAPSPVSESASEVLAKSKIEDDPQESGPHPPVGGAHPPDETTKKHGGLGPTPGRGSPKK
jgi:hypothetical protein